MHEDRRRTPDRRELAAGVGRSARPPTKSPSNSQVGRKFDTSTTSTSVDRRVRRCPGREVAQNSLGGGRTGLFVGQRDVLPRSGSKLTTRKRPVGRTLRSL